MPCDLESAPAFLGGESPIYSVLHTTLGKSSGFYRTECYISISPYISMTS